MRVYSCILVGLLALLLLPGEGFSQPPDGGGGRGGRMRGGRGGNGGGGRMRGGRMRMDPNQMFDNLANGKNEIVISQVTNPWVQSMLKRVADAAGVKGDTLTREQYLAGSQKLMAQFGGGRGGFPSRRGRGGPPDGGGGPPINGGAPDANLDQMAEAEFKKLDRNGDGVLNEDEMDPDLKAEYKQWDTNKDGLIDLKEFKAYFTARMQRQQQQGWGNYGQALITGKPEEEKRPVVFRVGKEPKGLPAWFKQLDTDNDGQIGLYEWRASGRPLSEFREMDRNHDGFLTMEEVMYYEAKNKTKNKGGTAIASTRSMNGPPSGDNRNFRRGPPNGGNFQRRPNQQ